MVVLDFIFSSIKDFWNLLFTVNTPFNISIGVLFFGCVILGIVFDFLLALFYGGRGD